MPFFKIH